jgi:cytochrome c-type biogenesis protein CcmH/NrfG
MQTVEAISKAKLYYLKTLDLLGDTTFRPFPFTWIGVVPNKAVILYKIGGICLTLGELEEAELALTKANNLDPRSGETWLLLCEVCLKTNRSYEANLSMRRAIKCGFSKIDTALLRYPPMKIHCHHSELL